MAKNKEEKNQTPENEETSQVTADENGEAKAGDVQEKDEKAEKIAELESQLKAEKDRYLRLAAEYDNFRKRSAKEREGLYQDVRSDTIVKLLPVYDNLARALAHETADTAYKKGVEMTMTQLEEILNKMNVTPIPAVGEKFDPALHNAVMHVEDETVEDSIIVQEYEKGFKLGDKVIRFSVVVVAN